MSEMMLLTLVGLGLAVLYAVSVHAKGGGPATGGHGRRLVAAMEESGKAAAGRVLEQRFGDAFAEMWLGHMLGALNKPAAGEPAATPPSPAPKS